MQSNQSCLFWNRKTETEKLNGKLDTSSFHSISQLLNFFVRELGGYRINNVA